MQGGDQIHEQANHMEKGTVSVESHTGLRPAGSDWTLESQRHTTNKAEMKYVLSLCVCKNSQVSLINKEILWSCPTAGSQPRATYMRREVANGIN